MLRLCVHGIHWSTRSGLQAGYLLTLIAAGILAACSDDDSATPSRGTWSTESLPSGLDGAALFGIAFQGDRGVAVGARATSPMPASVPVVLETTGGGAWQVVSPTNLPDDAILTDIAFVGSDAVLIGTRYPSGAPVILDARGGWSLAAVPGLSQGLLNAVAAGTGSARVVGVSATGVAVFSTAPDTWEGEDLAYSTGSNDKGLVDLAYSNGVFYGCGYDDAADGSPLEPRHMVMRNDGSGWEVFPSPVEAENWEVRAIAATADGGLLVGGAITNFSGNNDQYVAVLVARNPAGTWTTIDLPQPGTLDRVNDILVASDGMIFLACGLESMFLVASQGEDFTNEGPGTAGQIDALAEDEAGRIHAAGYETLGDDSARPILLRRDP